MYTTRETLDGQVQVEERRFLLVPRGHVLRRGLLKESLLDRGSRSGSDPATDNEPRSGGFGRVISGIVYVCKACPFSTTAEEKANEHKLIIGTTIKGSNFRHMVLKYEFRPDGSVRVT